MKVTVHCEGTPKEIAVQLAEASAVYIAAEGLKKSPKAAAEAAVEVTTKKVKKKVEEEEETFDLGGEEEVEEEVEAEEEVEVEAEAEEAEEEEEEAEVETPPPAKKVKKVELEDVISAFQKYAKKHSREKAAEVLKKFKVKSVHALPKDKYADVIAVLSK